MEKYPILDTISGKTQLVTSTYAETYLNDEPCANNNKKRRNKKEKNKSKKQNKQTIENDEWISPSDLLIGKLDLIPPFTSKIFRGTTHQGILAIGEDILEKEREDFNKYMNEILSQNDDIWAYVIEQQKEILRNKVKLMYKEIFERKKKILVDEINLFYEDTLQSVENHLKNEVNSVIIAAHTGIVSDLNEEIKQKLHKEKEILECELQNCYKREIKKLTHYYKLLLDYEINTNRKLVHHAANERREALSALYTQIHTQNLTSTMYVMCTERKKCRIKKIIMEYHQNLQIAEHEKKIKERQKMFADLKKREKRITVINKEWEEKIKKVLKLFLKFISFTLQLLPEQTDFFLDLEKMVILQLNEIQKAPSSKRSILIDINDNEFQFEKMSSKELICDKTPLELVGDLSDIPLPVFGSTETIPDDVELSCLRLGRKFIYAKCDKFNEVKEFLKACKCPSITPELTSTTMDSVASTSSENTLAETESSLEPMLVENIEILKQCPVRCCTDWIKNKPFTYFPSYLEFSEENYSRIKAILGKIETIGVESELTDISFIGRQELLFATTKEPYNNAGTQCSSKDAMFAPDFKCPCSAHYTQMTPGVSKVERSPEEKDKDLHEILRIRKMSLQKLIDEHPDLLKMFTDEHFDFKYPIKIN